MRKTALTFVKRLSAESLGEAGMSEEKGNIDWTEILRQAGGPQNLSPIATAKVFLLSAMLREERKRRETSNSMAPPERDETMYDVEMEMER